MPDIWLRKIRTFFHLLDVQKKGVITLEDFLLMPRQFADKENASSDLRDKTIKAFHDVYVKYTSSASSLPADKRVLTESVLIESCKQLKDDPEFKQNLRDMILSLFYMMDLNKDGYLQSDELRRAFENVGIVESEFTKAAFEAIDVNHNGVISPDEFISSFLDFVFSEDENSPNNYFFGPLLLGLSKGQ